LITGFSSKTAYANADPVNNYPELRLGVIVSKTSKIYITEHLIINFIRICEFKVLKAIDHFVHSIAEDNALFIEILFVLLQVSIEICLLWKKLFRKQMPLLDVLAHYSLDLLDLNWRIDFS